MLDEFDQLLKTQPVGQGAQGLSLFDDLLQTEPLSLNFNRKSAPWESSTVAQQANSVRMSPNEMYATGQFDPKAPETPGFFQSIGNEFQRGILTAARTASLAGPAALRLPQ